MVHMLDGLHHTGYAEEIITALRDPSATVNGLSYSSVDLSYVPPPNFPISAVEESGKFTFSNSPPWFRRTMPSTVLLLWPGGNPHSDAGEKLETLHLGAELEDDASTDPSTLEKTDDARLAWRIAYGAVIGERALARAGLRAATLQDTLYEQLGQDTHEIIVDEATNSDAPLGIIEIYETRRWWWFGPKTVTRAVLRHIAHAPPRWVLAQMHDALQEAANAVPDERVEV